MTMTEPAVPQALNFRGWFQTASRMFELPPPNHRPDVQRRGSESPHAGQALPSVTAPRSSTTQHGTAPVAGALAAAATIDPQDWDLLFQAVLETTARVAGEPTPANGAELRLQAPSDVLGECMDALDRLRRSVPVQPQRMSKPAMVGAFVTRDPASTVTGSN